MPLDFTQRLRDLTDNISRDEALLKSFEDALRFEDDPRRKMRYQQEIQQIQRSVESYRQEYESLERQSQSGTLTTEMQTVSGQLDRMDAKLNLVLGGQVELHQQQRMLLDRYDQSTQQILTTLTQQLDETQLALSNTLMEALEADALSEPEMHQMLAVLEDRLPALPPAEAQVMEIVKDPGLEAKHKLKVCVPLIPFLLDYEAELELGTEFNIRNAWQTVKTKLGVGQQ